MRQAIKALPVIVFLSAIAFATIFGSIRGIVHDPQHRPIQSAHVVLKSQTSDWTQSQDSNSNGEFEFSFRAHRQLHRYGHAAGISNKPGSR